MKKILLFVLAFGFGISSFAQQSYKFKIDTKEYKAVNKPIPGVEPVQNLAITKSQAEQKIVNPANERNTDIVTVIDLGTSANVYSYVVNGNNMLFADPMLNTVTNFHRMGGELDPGGYSGDLGYDISFDGGMTWENQVECYVAVDNGGGEYFFDAGRYPMHGLYSPTGSIDEAYLTWFAPVLDATNSDGTGWGGYLFGTIDVNDTSQRTRTIWTTENDVYREVPEGYDLSANGVSHGLGMNEDWTSGALVYQQQMIYDRGEWDADEQDFVYTEYLIDAEATADVVVAANHRIAFGPDGMTGYIVLLSDNGEAEQQSGFLNYYPIVYKTTDGGETWSDPEFIQLDGADGIGGIVYNHLTDTQIEELFEPPVPAREEISYTTAFDCDIAVDKNNNLHIAVVISTTGSDPHSIISAAGYIRPVDIFTTDGGETWEVEHMGSIRTFRGTFGDLTEDNRIQITTNYDRDKIFISWLDTDLEEEEDNNRPNIWCRGFDPFASPYLLTANAAGESAPTNVTNFSAGMWQSYLGVAAQLALEPAEGTYVIPMVYVEMDPSDPLVPVTYKYITDFTYTDANFTITSIGDGIEANENNAVVSQNYPNPFNGNSYVTVNLNEGADLSLEVYTITGQQVSSQDYGYTSAGSITLTISGNQLTPGVYFYTVKAGDSKVTRKMIVE